MLFTWKIIPTGYEYTTEDQVVFGKITFRSPVELDPGECDDIVATLLKDATPSTLVKGAIMLQREDTPIDIYYEFKKKPQWETVTTNIKAKKPEKLGRLQRLLRNLASVPQRIISTLAKFVVAFKEAYKRLGD